MRRVVLGETGIETSALGFGCASLGSRVGAEAGRRALEEAHAAGVTWFDLAPVYGGGAAEAIAGPFLKANRDRVQVATKAGLLLAGGAAGGLRRRLAPLARGALALARPAAARLRRAAPPANAKPPLTPALIVGSLEASLRRLGLDHVELFALHAPDPAEVGRDDDPRRARGRRRRRQGPGGGGRRRRRGGGGGARGRRALRRGAAGGAAARGAEGRGRRRPCSRGAVGRVRHHRALGLRPPAARWRPPRAGGGWRRPSRSIPTGVVLVSMLSAESRAATLAAAEAPVGARGSGRPPAAAGRGR